MASVAGERVPDATVLLVGRTGSGKSTTGNTLTGKSTFAVGGGFSSVTRDVASEVVELANAALRGGSKLVKVIDSIGHGDSKLSHSEQLTFFQPFQDQAPNGIDLIVYVMRLGRFDEAVQESVKLTFELLGDACKSNAIILVTGCGANPDSKVEEFLSLPEFQPFKHYFGLGVLCIENQAADAMPKLRSQIAGLLKRTEGRPCSNSHFQEAKQWRQQAMARIARLPGDLQRPPTSELALLLRGQASRDSVNSSIQEQERLDQRRKEEERQRQEAQKRADEEARRRQEAQRRADEEAQRVRNQWKSTVNGRISALPVHMQKPAKDALALFERGLSNQETVDGKLSELEKKRSDDQAAATRAAQNQWKATVDGRILALPAHMQKPAKDALALFEGGQSTQQTVNAKLSELEKKRSDDQAAATRAAEEKARRLQEEKEAEERRQKEADEKQRKEKEEERRAEERRQSQRNAASVGLGLGGAAATGAAAGAALGPAGALAGAALGGLFGFLGGQAS